jgi:tRNA pseudouridine55 synthase
VTELHGILVVDKPPGLTSSEVVVDVRRRLRAASGGHTGTLDPLATGVLPICLGEATKLAGLLLSDDKAYEAELELGVQTDTQDAEGAVIARDPEGAARVTEPALLAALAALTGELEQLPPMFSAVKVGGKRLYEAARAGAEVERAARRVVVHELRLVSFEPPRARVAVVCSKGTFVRTLVHDLGQALGCGAYLTALRRTRSGVFHLDQAVPLNLVTAARAAAGLVRPADALGLPRIAIEPAQHRALLDGNPAAFSYLRDHTDLGPRFQMVTPEGDLLAIVVQGVDKVHFERVFRYALDPSAFRPGDKPRGRA